VVDVSDPEHPAYAGTVRTGYASELAVSPSGHVLVADREDGLLVLAGPDLNDDARAPAPINDLRATALTSTSVSLQWTAVGDDGYYGTAAGYALRRALTPILDLADWDAATPLSGLPAPLPAGRIQTHVADGLAPDTEWHFAVQAIDDEGRVGPLGREGVVTTPSAGTFLRDGRLDEDYGTDETVFTYEVVYLDGDGVEPVVHDVLISGEAQAMTRIEGTPLTGALYRHQTTLAIGSHDFAFRFGDGEENTVETQAEAGPTVGAVIFLMGSEPDEFGRREDEALHVVLLDRDVEAAATEVTQAEYAALTPGYTATAGDLPVTGVDWFEAVAYCNALSLHDGLAPVYAVDGLTVDWNRDADGWRLPTEAEWEYLCRAGAATSLPDADVSAFRCAADPDLERFAWYCGNADGPQAVGQKAANAFGLHDMHGNVREWCWDWYGEYGPSANAPTGPPVGERRVVRGGSWHYHAEECRSAARGTFYPDSADDFVGFRVVRNR
jgi:formylglycine-generating enzyme required for sulfatase activity